MKKLYILPLIFILALTISRVEGQQTVEDEFGCLDPANFTLQAVAHATGGTVGGTSRTGSKMTWKLEGHPDGIYVRSLTLRYSHGTGATTKLKISVASWNFTWDSNWPANRLDRTLPLPELAKEIVVDAVPTAAGSVISVNSITVGTCASNIITPAKAPYGCKQEKDIKNATALDAITQATGGSIFVHSGGNSRRGQEIIFDLPNPVTLAGIHPGIATASDSTPILNVRVEATVDSPNPTINQPLGPVGNPYEHNPATPLASQAITYFRKRIKTQRIVFSGFKLGSPTAYEIMYLRNLTLWRCDPEIIFQRPYKTQDEDSHFKIYSTFDYSTQNTLPANINFAMSNKESAPVYSVVEGNVVEKVLLSQSACSAYFAGATASICPHLPPSKLYSGLGFFVSQMSLLGNPIANYVPIYRVRVQTFEAKTMTYLMTNPMVKIGQFVDRGCRIGDSIKTILGPTESKSIIALGYGNALGTTPATESFEEITLNDYPTPGLDCNVKEIVQKPLTAADEYITQFDGFSPPYYNQYEFCLKVISIPGLNTGLANCDYEGLVLRRLFVNAPPNVKFSLSKEIRAPVYSIAAGEVISKRKITVQECLTLTSGISYTNADDGCVIEIPAYANPAGKDFFYNAVKYLTIELSAEIWEVQVKTTDGNLVNYILTDPQVDIGDNLQVNCLLGRTLPVGSSVAVNQKVVSFIQQVFSVASGLFNLLWGEQSTFDGKGVVLIGYEDYSPQFYENGVFPVMGEHDFDRIWLDEYPSPGLACNVEGAFSDCLTVNPKFNNNGEFWEIATPGRVIWNNPGVVLEAQGSIRLPAISLDPAKQYGASTNAKSEGFEGQLQVSVGKSVFKLQVPPTATALTINPQVMTATSGTLYDIVLTNTGQYDLTIEHFCVTEGAPNLYPSNCYFKNNGFDLGTTFWQINGAYTHEYVPPNGLPPWDIGRVNVNLTDEGYNTEFEQNAKLFPDEDGTPHTYQVFVQYEIPTSLPLSTMPITFFYEYGTQYQSVNLDRTKKVYTFTVTVTSPTDDNFYFSFSAPNADSVKPINVYVTKFCIEGPYPQQGGGGEQPDTDPTCAAAPAFPGYDVAKLTVWHWQNIDRFNKCDLMPKLQDIFKTLKKLLNFMGDSTQWGMYSTYRAVEWLGSDLLPWAAGYWSNIQPGVINVNNQQCTGLDLACLISSFLDLIRTTIQGFFEVIPQVIRDIVKPILDFILYVLGMAANLFFGLLTAIIALLLDLIAKIIEILMIGLRVFEGLIKAWNTATPRPIQGLPNCSVETKGLCTLWWVMDNTLLSGAGAAIIPAITSFGWILLAIWIIREIKKLMNSVSNA
jgi:hypothetical protein